VDFGGSIVVADNLNHRIRKITPQGHVSTLAGTGEWGHRDGEWTVAQFNWPKGIAVDGGGNIIVTDMLNHRYPQDHTTRPFVHSGRHWRGGL
jgi:DNA-binding beta-propeller fold protein YncE